MTFEEAIKYCEEHKCEECSVEDKRTEYQKKILQYPCCWNLVDKEKQNDRLGNYQRCSCYLFLL